MPRAQAVDDTGGEVLGGRSPRPCPRRFRPAGAGCPEGTLGTAGVVGPRRRGDGTGEPGPARAAPGIRGGARDSRPGLGLSLGLGLGLSLCLGLGPSGSRAPDLRPSSRAGLAS